MMKFILALIFVFPITLSAQTYQEVYEKAIDYIDTDSLKQAEVLLKKAVEMEPGNAKNSMLFSNLGLVQRRLGEYNKAIDSYSYALNFAPLNVPILLDRAALYLEIGKPNAAYVDYCQVMDQDKENKEALLMRAYIYMQRRDYPAARIDYDRLLAIDPDSYSGQLGLVTLNQKEGRTKEAFDLINKMIAASYEDPTLYIVRAEIEKNMDHIELALVDLEEAIKLNPSLPEAYLTRGNIYLTLKKKTLANTDFEKAISLGIPRADLIEQLKQCK